MKNIGIAAIVVGILILLLGLAGVIGQGGNVRSVIIGAVIILVVGLFLYGRGRSGRAR